MIGWLPIPAGADQASQRRRKRLQVTHFVFHMFQLGLRFSLDITTAGLRTDPEIEEFLDLMEREAQRLGVPNKPKTSLSVGVVQPVTGRQPRSRTEHVESLVVANRFDIHAHLFRELPNLEFCRHVCLTADDTPCTIVRSQGGKSAFFFMPLPASILLNKRLLFIASTAKGPGASTL